MTFQIKKVVKRLLFEFLDFSVSSHVLSGAAADLLKSGQYLFIKTLVLRIAKIVRSDNLKFQCATFALLRSEFHVTAPHCLCWGAELQ